MFSVSLFASGQLLYEIQSIYTYNLATLTCEEHHHDCAFLFFGSLSICYQTNLPTDLQVWWKSKQECEKKGLSLWKVKLVL